MPAHICVCVWCVTAYNYIKALELRAVARTSVWEPEVRLPLKADRILGRAPVPMTTCTAGCPSGLAESPEACPRFFLPLLFISLKYQTKELFFFFLR